MADWETTAVGNEMKNKTLDAIAGGAPEVKGIGDMALTSSFARAARQAHEKNVATGMKAEQEMGAEQLGIGRAQLNESVRQSEGKRELEQEKMDMARMLGDKATIAALMGTIAQGAFMLSNESKQDAIQKRHEDMISKYGVLSDMIPTAFEAMKSGQTEKLDAMKARTEFIAKNAGSDFDLGDGIAQKALSHREAAGMYDWAQRNKVSDPLNFKTHSYDTVGAFRAGVAPGAEDYRLPGHKEFTQKSKYFTPSGGYGMQ